MTKMYYPPTNCLSIGNALNPFSDDIVSGC